MVRAWQGTTEEGAPVVALVAGVQVPADFPMPNLVPIPPPDPAWSPALRDTIGLLWKIAPKLTDQEAEGLVRFAALLVGIENIDDRRAAADEFLRGIAELSADG